MNVEVNSNPSDPNNPSGKPFEERPVDNAMVDELAKEEKAGIHDRKMESFIPLRHSDLIARLQKSVNISPEDQVVFKELCDHLTAIFHIEHLTSLMKVEDLYAPVDPDSEAVELFELSESERTERIDKLFDRMTQVLYSAHYHRLDREELETAIGIGYRWGVRLDVDFEVFERLEIFARGWRSVKKTRRRWQRLFIEESIEMPEFHRLVLIFRLKDSKRLDETMETSTVYLKMFKNIPETDLEILLPGSKVRLSVFDQGKILVPNLSSAAMSVYKIFRLGVFLTIIAAAAIIKWVLAIAVLVGYMTKATFSYFNTKNKYQFGLTKSLYLKNLDNNAGVIYRLYNEAEEQEMCETVLAYSMLLQHCLGDGLTEPEIKGLSKEYLRDTVKFPVEFDIHDALGKLARLGLANVDESGRWTAIQLKDATSQLQKNWQQIFRQRKGEKDSLEDDLFTSS